MLRDSTKNTSAIACLRTNISDLPISDDKVLKTLEMDDDPLQEIDAQIRENWLISDEDELEIPENDVQNRESWLTLDDNELEFLKDDYEQAEDVIALLDPLKPALNMKEAFANWLDTQSEKEKQAFQDFAAGLQKIFLSYAEEGSLAIEYNSVIQSFCVSKSDFLKEFLKNHREIADYLKKHFSTPSLLVEVLQRFQAPLLDNLPIKRPSHLTSIAVIEKTIAAQLINSTRFEEIRKVLVVEVESKYSQPVVNRPNDTCLKHTVTLWSGGKIHTLPESEHKFLEGFSSKDTGLIQKFKQYVEDNWKFFHEPNEAPAIEGVDNSVTKQNR